MDSKNLIRPDITSDDIKGKIYTIHGVQVMLDSDLAQIYGYETKNFNRQVKNNIEKFDDDFMFQLTKDEYLNILRCKNFTSSWGGTRKLPYAFTEQGIYMLMTVLKGELAVMQSKILIRLFKQMREYMLQNSAIFQRIENLELFKLEADKNFKEIFAKLDEPREKKEILFDSGTFYDAVSHLEEVISSAKTSIILIDGYVDKNTLDMLSKKQSGVSIEIYTYTNLNKITQSEIAAFNKQYGNLTIKASKNFHDRFLILDRAEFYYIGTSLNKNTGGKITSMFKGSDPGILQHLIHLL